MARTNKNPKVSLLSRDFQSIRSDLETFLQAFYPEVWKDFNVTSPGMALVDLNAYVGDLLSYIADKKYNENYLDGVSERKSVYRLAKTKGYRPPGFRPGVSLADITIEVPVTSNGPNPDYLPIYREGMQVNGSGQIYETEFPIDFSSDFSEEGTANRTIEPVLNSNQDIVRYKIVKREKIKAGVTKIYSQEISPEDAIPFFNLTLPDNNVLDILNVISINQIGISQTPTYAEFNDPDNEFTEVKFLAQNRVFKEDPTSERVDGVAIGKLVEVEKRYEKHFLSDGSCLLQFGSGTPDYNAYEQYLKDITSIASTNSIDSSVLLDNTALGQTVASNSTIFVKYRVGGGLSSNVGQGVLTELSNIDALILGSDSNLNQQVIQSTRAFNPIPAVGGAGLPSVEEIKHFTAGNHAAQDRCVTLRDYLAIAAQVPGKFGAPFRVQGKIEDNKVKLYILSRNGSGRLVSSSTSTIKNNLATWLSQYRMINDFVEINDGKVVNLQCEVDLYVDNTFNVNEIKLAAIKEIKDFLDISKKQMNEHIYISQITDLLREIPGIINVVDIRFFNMEGGGYSNSVISQATINKVSVPGTGGYRTQIEYIDNTIFGTPLSMFEIKFSQKDIRVRVG
jgi:hypothetical protein